MPVTPLPALLPRNAAGFVQSVEDRLEAEVVFSQELNALQEDVNAKYNAVLAGAAAAGGIAASVLTAAASAAQAVVAKDQALAAWAAAMFPAETLPAISKSIHSGAVIKGIIYDTSKDSDGGAWRKRCTDKSWYQEALGFSGAWRGQLANAAAAWAVSGAAAGDGYQNTTDGKYYVLSGTNSQTEIFRGNVREFPEQVAIIAEASRVVIYDLTQVGCPMWMVYTAAHLNDMTSGSFTSVAALDGRVVVGRSAATNFAGLAQFSFPSDITTHHRFTGYATDQRRANKAHPASADYVAGVTLPAIVNATVNDVAITALDGAPIDPATGLPVPTIAVATAGGVSVIKHDGTVVNSSHTGNTTGLAILGAVLWTNFVGGASSNLGYKDLSGIAASWSFTFVTSPSTRVSLTDNSTKVVAARSVVSGTSMGLAALKDNPATPAKGMVAYITKDYNTGWMPGDIRGAYLADTTAETITGSGELVTNGTFASDIASWTDQTSTDATPSWVSGKLRLTRDTANTPANVYQGVATVAGKTYTFSVGIVSTCLTFIRASTTTAGTGDLASSGSVAAGTSTQTFTFTAQGATSYISVWVYTGAIATTADFDNISVKLADPDRSVKNNGLIVNGTLTKTAVADGSGLVAYSGFSAANYLEQPYNANLDFGTGDFSVMGWANLTSIASTQVLFSRGTAAAPTVEIFATTSTWNYVVSTGNTTTNTSVAVTTGLHLVGLARVSGVVYFYLDGIQVFSAANASNVNNASATCRLGLEFTGSAPTLGPLALWRISATAPSADQIAHIYRTELPLFQAGAACTIAGISSAVAAMAYDDVADTLQVGTSWGRSGFKDLLRIDSEATTTGAITSLSASQGAILTGGASAKFYQPAMLLRDELRRKDEARKALGKVPVFFDYTATASQTAFVLPKGYTTKALYKNGTLMRETTTGVYWSRSNDGFQESATLSVGATISDWISIMAVRA